jgi:hypothetical protein
MVTVSSSLNLLDLGQDIIQLGVVDIASTRAAAIDAKCGGAGKKGGEDSERNHCAKDEETSMMLAVFTRVVAFKFPWWEGKALIYDAPPQKTAG